MRRTGHSKLQFWEGTIEGQLQENHRWIFSAALPIIGANPLLEEDGLGNLIRDANPIDAERIKSPTN